MILLCTKITLWEFFKTKMKHHVMRNHVMGNHVSGGTTVMKNCFQFYHNDTMNQINAKKNYLANLQFQNSCL